MQTSSSATTQRPLTEFSDLYHSVKQTTEHFKKIHKNFTRLKQVNDSLCDFNDAFSAFLFGMAANDKTIDWTEAPSTNTLERYKEHIKRLNTQEVTKAVVPTQAEDKPIATRGRKRKLVSKTTAEKPIVSKRKFVTKVDIGRIIDARLPRQYREQVDARRYMETFLKILALHPSGLTKKELVSETKLPAVKVQECIGALEHAKEIVKISEAGKYAKFLLDPSKYYSKDK